MAEPENNSLSDEDAAAQVRHYTEVWGIMFVYKFTPNCNAVRGMDNESDVGRLKRMLYALANDVSANQIRNENRYDHHEERLNAQSERMDERLREGLDELRNKVALLEATNNDLVEANGMLTEVIKDLRESHDRILLRVVLGEQTVDDNLRKMGVDILAMNTTLKVEAEAHQHTRAVVERTSNGLADMEVNVSRRMAGFASKLEALTKSIRFKLKKNPDVST